MEQDFQDQTQTLSQRFIFKLLKHIKFGKLTIHDPSGQYIFCGKEVPSKHVQVDVHDLKAYKNICLNGSLGAAESYMAGLWDTNDLTALIELMIKNTELFYSIDNFFAKTIQAILNISPLFNNSIARAKKNILAHYDLGNEFFKLFLDPKMMYSCALYEPENINLNAASEKKLQTICHQLQLQSSDHLLEIGTGWGGFAIYAAKEFGCTITTTTISDQQYQYAKQEVQRLGLQDKIEVLNKDYRELHGCYDKLVSIEMIEAIGYQYFDLFFKQCNALLKPGGLFFLQAIVINDQTYEQAKHHVDFIKKYIFPGGCLPSIKVISNSIANHSQMQLLQLRDIGKHYVATLLDWLARFNDHTDQVLQQQFSQQFIRMWRYYFCYCAAGFRSNYIGDIQAVWRKRI